jgi:hypothetical protein
MVCVGILAVVLVAGCATTPKGPTDEELIMGQVAKFKEAMLAKNLDNLLAVVSENFNHPEVGGKAEAREILQQGIDSGYTEGGQVDISKAVIKLDDKKETATVYPIQASSNAGSVTVGLTLKKEKVGWMITMLDVEGI